MEKLTFSGSPHIRSKRTSTGIMIDVCIALLPACILGCVFFGLSALLILSISLLTAVASEILYNMLINKMSFKACLNSFDFTSAVTGLLIGMNMPPLIDWYVPLLASLFAVVVVKMLFGGTGKNLFNPAVAGRVFAFLSFSSAMTKATNFASGSIALSSGATPLTEFLNNGVLGGDLTLMNMFLGNVPGCIGETSALALIVGGLYLAIRGVIDLKLPIITLAFTGITCVAINNFDFSVFLPNILGGGLMLGAIFMATDYVTTPNTISGRVLYFALLGVLIGVLRYSKAADRIEVVSFAILMMNITVPLFDRFIVNKPFGYTKKRKEAKVK